MYGTDHREGRSWRILQRRVARMSRVAIGLCRRESILWTHAAPLNAFVFEFVVKFSEELTVEEHLKGVGCFSKLDNGILGEECLAPVFEIQQDAICHNLNMLHTCGHLYSQYPYRIGFVGGNALQGSRRRVTPSAANAVDFWRDLN